MVNEQVCQQVPVRVPVPGTKTVPQPARWEMRCEEYQVPKQEVQSSPDSGSVTIPVENCDIVEEDKQYCARLPTEVLCSNTTMTKQVRYKRRVCDRQSFT